MKKRRTKQWLTDAVLAALQPNSRPYEIADAHPGKQGTGLLVRVQPTGLKSLYATYKVTGAGDPYTKGGITRRRAGPTRRVFLGRWPDDIEVEEARFRAQKLVKVARAGTDPVPRDDAPTGQPGTIKEIAEAYRVSGISTNIKNWWAPLRDVVVARWGDRSPDQLDATTFQGALRVLVKDGEYPRARVVRDVTRAMYNEMLPDLPNPAGKLPNGLAKALRRKKKTGTAFTDDELRAFWAISEGWGDPRTGMPGRFGLVARFALLTGVRSDSALSQLRWPNVRDDRVLFDPPEEGSGKRWPLALPMTEGIRRLVDAARSHQRDDCDLVFWTRKRDGTFEGAQPDPGVMRERADGALASKTIKELRHTAVTRISDMGQRELARVLTAHSGGTIDIYNSALYLEPLRDVLTRWETELQRVLADDDDAEEAA